MVGELLRPAMTDGSHLRPVPGFSMLVETVPICVRASRAEGAGGQRLDESTFGESDSV